MPPDIALVSAYPPPGAHHAGRSGVASYTSNLARALVAGGASVSVVAPREPDAPGDYDDDGVHVTCGFDRGPLSLVHAARAAAATGAPIVHLQHEMFLYGGPASAALLPLALTILRSRGRSTVVTMHQVVHPDEIDGAFVRLHHVRATPIIARAGVASVNRSVRELADAVVVHEPRFSRAFTRAAVIPHGVESRTPPDRSAARRELGVDERPVVLCFGFLAPYKGLEVALEAARIAGGAFELVIAGGDHPRDASYGERLRERWTSGARFTGYVSESDLPLWFAACDVALFPYPRPFSSSGAIALALAYGTPVLMSAPLADCMQAPHDLIAPLEPTPLARRLVSVTSSAGALEALRGVSAGMAASRRWDNVAQRHLEVYEEVSDAGRPARRRVRSG